MKVASNLQVMNDVVRLFKWINFVCSSLACFLMDRPYIFPSSRPFDGVCGICCGGNDVPHTKTSLVYQAIGREVSMQLLEKCGTYVIAPNQ